MFEISCQTWVFPHYYFVMYLICVYCCLHCEETDPDQHIDFFLFSNFPLTTVLWNWCYKPCTYSFGEGNGNPLQGSCQKKSHRQKNPAGYGPRGHKELDMTEWLSMCVHTHTRAHAHTHTHACVHTHTLLQNSQQSVEMTAFMACSPIRPLILCGMSWLAHSRFTIYF